MPRHRLGPGLSSSSEDLGGRTRRRGTPQDPSPPSDGISDDERRPRDDATTINGPRSDIVPTVCRYTQAEVTSARRSVLGWETTARKLQLDFDPRHEVWHLVTPAEFAARGRSEAPSGRAPGQKLQESDHRSLECSSQNELLPSNGGSASYALDEIGTNTCGNADLSTSAFAASGNRAGLEAIDMIDRPGPNSARDRCSEDEEAPGDGAAICPVERNLAAGGLIRQQADEDAANCGAAGSSTAMEDNDRPVKCTTSAAAPCYEERRRKAGSPPVSAPDPSAGSTQQGEPTVERPASKQEGGGPEPEVVTTDTAPPDTEFALGGIPKTCAGPERAQEDASKSDDIPITSALGTGESVAAVASAEQWGSLSAAAGSRSVRPDNRGVAAGAVDRTMNKKGECIGDDDRVENLRTGDAEEKRDERRIGATDFPSPKRSCGSKVIIPDGNDQLGQLPTASPTESPIVETTPGPQPAPDAGGPVRKTGGTPEGSGNETSTGQDRNGLLRVTWRGEPVTLFGPIAITLEETRVGKPYPGRKIGGYDRERHLCASARRDSKGTGGKPGSDGECLSSDEVDRIFSSDEESDGSSHGPPSQGKSTAEFRVRKGHENGAVDEHSNGSRRSESSSTRDEAIVTPEEAKSGGRERHHEIAKAPRKATCDDKVGEGPLLPTTHNFDDKHRQHHRHRSARQQQQHPEGNEALPVPLTRSPDNAPPQSYLTDGGSTFNPPSLARSVVFLPEPYLGPPVAACPRTWPTGSSILADGCASTRKTVTRGVGGARREEKGSDASSSRKECNGSSTSTCKSSSGSTEGFSEDSNVDWEKGEFASDTKQTSPNEGKPRKGERIDGRRSQWAGGARK